MSRTFLRMRRRYEYLHRVYLTPKVQRTLWQRLTFWLLKDRFESQARKLYGACIPISCYISPKAHFPHFWYGLHMGDGASIGDNVTVMHHVTLGGWHGYPQIEDDVFLGAGAVLVGPTHVGRGSRIGANITLSGVTIPPKSVIVAAGAYDVAHHVAVYPAYRHPQLPAASVDIAQGAERDAKTAA